MGPPDAATDRILARLQGLADSGRLCSDAQATESGAARHRAGPSGKAGNSLRWVPSRAADSEKVAGARVRFAEAARRCLQRTGGPAGA
eukprot:5616639-Alexandrium_andersonii.AAC.1